MKEAVARSRSRSARAVSFAAALAALAAGCPAPAAPSADDAGEPRVGARCDDARPCGAGTSCLHEFPDGYCTALCADAACPAGSRCDLRISPAICVAACAAQADCRAGYQCFLGGCVPACTDASSCGVAGASCVAGRCELTDADGGVEGGLAPGAPGEPCSSDAACASGICLPPERGAVCSVPCTDPLSCAAGVPFSAVCGALARGEGVEKLCLPFDPAGVADGEPCASDDDCQSRTCSAQVCIQGCDEARDCPLGMECGEAPYGSGRIEGCRIPPGDRYEVSLPSATLAAGYGTGLSRIVLPADVASVTLQAVQRSGERLAMGFHTVNQSVAGSLVTHFDLEGLFRYEDQPNRWLPLDGYEVVTMGLPNSTPDRVAIAPTALRFGLLAFSRSEGDAGRVTFEPRVLVRRGRDPGTGSIDVAVHLVGVGVSASAAPTNSRVRAMLARFDEILAEVGLRRGATSYEDVDAPSLAVIDSDEGPDSELAQLFRLSAARSGRILSLFLVRSIETGGHGFNTLGVAGGIPGPIGVHGTMHSGVAIAFDPSVAGDGRLAGHIAAHESAHYLGLFHVTEQVRACGAGETPATASCAPFGGGDTLADTALGDTSNLMHWSLVGAGGTNVALSAGQGYVLRRSGLVSWP